MNGDGQAVTITTINDESWAKVMNFLSFGTFFFNKKIEISVKVTDDISGIKNVVLKTSDKAVPEIEADSLELHEKAGIAKFTLDVDHFKGTFSIEATDNVNHKKTYDITKDNSTIISDENEVVVEKNKPDAKIEVSPKEGVTSNGDNQYSGDVAFHVTVEDPEAGVSTVSINVNGQNYPFDYSEELAKRDQPITYSIQTEDNQINIDGSYVVSVDVTDNAGNKNKAEKTIYIDRSHPTITNFSFSTADANVTATEELTEVAQLTEYGYYFNKPTSVTIAAEDPKVDYEFTSHVKSMTIFIERL